MTRAHPLLLSASIALAACGGLESPDLGAGTVAGRVTHALPGAYVYPFGSAGLRAAVAADGSFSIAGVPVETTSIVVIDGEAADRTRRAQMIPVHVLGAERADVGSVDASAMPLAAIVVAAAQPGGGSAPASPVFSIAGTEREGVVAAVETVALGPIPAGSFELVTSMKGFAESRQTVDVQPGVTVSLTVRIEPDLASDRPGCASAGCRSAALRCGGDGRCHECVVDADCVARYASGYQCDPELLLCKATATAMLAGGVCDACTDASQCYGYDALCVPFGTSGSGYCSRSCSTAGGCPAGFDCVGSVCVAPDGCAAYFERFGDACLGDSACALNGRRCRGAVVSSAPAAGFCTAPCATSADCIAPGYPSCDAVAKVCTR